MTPSTAPGSPVPVPGRDGGSEAPASSTVVPAVQAAPAAAPTRTVRDVIRDVVRLMRHRQWTKNLAVFAAIIFAGRLGQPALLGRVALAFVALDLVSSATYAANDVLDAERDRQHPVKRERPIAAGRLSVAQGWAVAAVSLALGLALSALLGWPFLAAVGVFVALQAAYTVSLKHVAIVDMIVIAAGFVVRAVAGGLVIAVPISPWLVLCTGLLALFLAAAKRRHELVLLAGASASHRPVLEEYSAELLDSFMVTLSAATVTSYALYTFFEPRSISHTMMLTVPFVLYGVLRYQALVLAGGGGRPEEVLLTDRPIILDIMLWILTAVFVLYALPNYLH